MNTDIETWFSVTQFYYREARYLDDLEFDKWVTLLAPDLRYWMPIVSNRIGRDIGNELTRYGDLAHFEDDHESMSNRVKRLATGRAWAETPPGRTNHMISNVEIMGQTGDEVQVRSQFLIYRSHMETDQEMFSGTRKDTLRADDETTWKVVDRAIILDHAVLTQKSLGIFF
ncbi:MAG: aromatic-ring-hydroxylating dioxygenase subunit beta [Pikeienuella sp.]